MATCSYHPLAYEGFKTTLKEQAMETCFQTVQFLALFPEVSQDRGLAELKGPE